MSNRKEGRPQAKEGGPTHQWTAIGIGTEQDRRDFVSGTIFADGCGIISAGDLLPGEDSGPPPKPMFFIAVPRHTALTPLFDRMRQKGAAVLADEIKGVVGWAGMGPVGGQPPLAKLKLHLSRPTVVDAEILLLADEFVEPLHIAAQGGWMLIHDPQALSEIRQLFPEGGSLEEAVTRAIIIDMPPSTTLPTLLRLCR